MRKRKVYRSALRDGQWFRQMPIPEAHRWGGKLMSAFNLYRCGRVQEACSFLTTYVEAARAFGNDAFYEQAVRVAQATVRDHVDERGCVNSWYEQDDPLPNDYTTVIAPLVDLVFLVCEMERRGDARAAELRQAGIRVADFLVRRGLYFPTEGAAQHRRWMEDGSISCTALSLIYAYWHLDRSGKRIGKGSSQNQVGSEFTKGLLDSIKNANTEEEIRVILERQYNEALLGAEPSSAAMESKKMKWAALISMTMGESDFASKAFMASIEEQIALGNRMIIEAYKLAEQTIENEKNSIGELEKTRTQTPEDYLVEKLETENKAFEESAKALSNVTDAFMAYQKVAEDADSSIVDTTDATMSFLEAIEKLNIAGLETKSMGDFMKDGVLDTSALEDYRDQVFQLILENSNLKYSNIDLYNSLVSLWEEAKVEIQGGVSTLVQGIRLSGNEFASLINMTAGEMWELAQQEQIILYDSQGTEITTN